MDKKRTTFRLITFVFIAFVLSAVSCINNLSAAASLSQTLRAPFSNIDVTFTDISVYSSDNSEWISIMSDQKTVNLSSLADLGLTQVIGDNNIPSGNYTKVRYTISEAVGKPKNNNQQFVFELSDVIFEENYSFTVNSGNSYLLTIQFDLFGSITDTVTGYKYFPVVSKISLMKYEEFVCTIKPTGGDYTTLSQWSEAIDCDLTVSTNVVFNGVKTGTMNDGALVTGSVSGAQAKVWHATVDGTQIFVNVTNGMFASGEQIRVNESNYFTTSDNGNLVIAVAECYAMEHPGSVYLAAHTGHWTTGPNNYIEIRTPVSERHNGKWDDTKFRMTVDDESYGFSVAASHVRLDGLQIEVLNEASDHARGIELSGSSEYGPWDRRISNCIIKGKDSFTGGLTRYGISYSGSACSSSAVKLWNDVIYDFNTTGDVICRGIYAGRQNSRWYLYNNTIQNCKTGICSNNAEAVIVMNTLVQDCNNGFEGNFDTSSDYNLSDLANDAPGTNSKNETTVSFVNKSGDDFHLLKADAGAKDSGVDLSTNLNLYFAADIDGESREGNWDIGADEYFTPLPVEFICTIKSTGGDYATLNQWTEAIDCDLTVPTNVVFNGTKTGTINDGTMVTGSISGAYGKVWHATVEGTQIFINITSGTFVADEQIRVNEFNYFTTSSNGTGAIAVAECYAMEHPGNVYLAAHTGHWTTSPDNYIEIRTPVSERHTGTLDDTKFKITADDEGYGFSIAASDVRLDGLQIEVLNEASDHARGIELSGSSEYAPWDRRIANCIIKGKGNFAGGLTRYGISYSGSASLNSMVKLWNNVVYDFNAASTNTACIGVWAGKQNSKWYVYNNTIQNCKTGIYGGNAEAVIVKNTIVQDCSDGFKNNFDASSDYNLSDLAGDAPGTNSKNETTVSFVNKSGDDFHLADRDTGARNAGVDLLTDLFLAFNYDIDGNERPVDDVWDMGADEESTLGMMKVVRQQLADPTFKLGDVYAYPNPSKGGIKPTIHVEVGMADSVNLKIYNLAAELIYEVDIDDTLKIVDNKYAYEYQWNTAGIASGVYIYYVDAQKSGKNHIKIVRKLALIR